MNNGTDVMLPEGHEVAALDRLMQLQQEHALLDRPLAAIDMRLPRPAGAASAARAERRAAADAAKKPT